MGLKRSHKGNSSVSGSSLVINNYLKQLAGLNAAECKIIILKISSSNIVLWQVGSSNATLFKQCSLNSLTQLTNTNQIEF